MRYGKPVVLEIDTGQMQKDGLKFFRSKNGVWLTEYVSPEYIKLDALH
jgi:putative RNA 2'-phosphotransferase